MIATSSVRTLQQYYAKFLAAMIGDSNARYSQPNTGNFGYRTSFNPGKFKANAGTRKNAPGRKRKLGTNKFMTPAPANPTRRACKTLCGEIRHMLFPRGSHIPVITMDNTAKIGQVLGCKIQVKQNKMYIRNNTVEIRDWLNILKDHPIPQ